MTENREPYPVGTACSLCGGLATPTDPMTRGHIIPKALGGPDALWNIRPEHLSCNQNC